MKDDCCGVFSDQLECSALSVAWRGVGYVAAIAGVFALLAATGRSQEAVNSDRPTDPSEYRGVAPLHSMTVALHSREQLDDALPARPHKLSTFDIENFLTRTDGGGLEATQIGLGRCNRKTACHYSVTLAGLWDTQAVYTSETDAAETFRSACAAKDLSGLSQIEQLGFSGDVPPERVAAAAVTLFSARTNCAQGRVTEAFEQYENLLANTVASDGAR